MSFSLSRKPVCHSMNSQGNMNVSKHEKNTPETSYCTCESGSCAWKRESCPEGIACAAAASSLLNSCSKQMRIASVICWMTFPIWARHYVLNLYAYIVGWYISGSFRRLLNKVYMHACRKAEHEDLFSFDSFTFTYLRHVSDNHTCMHTWTEGRNKCAIPGAVILGAVCLASALVVLLGLYGNAHGGAPARAAPHHYLLAQLFGTFLHTRLLNLDAPATAILIIIKGPETAFNGC